jgi:hypothetical protein
MQKQNNTPYIHQSSGCVSGSLTAWVIGWLFTLGVNPVPVDWSSSLFRTVSYGFVWPLVLGQYVAKLLGG